MSSYQLLSLCTTVITVIKHTNGKKIYKTCFSETNIWDEVDNWKTFGIAKRRLELFFCILLLSLPSES